MPIEVATLEEQRLALRERLRAQRAQIVRQLDPATAIHGDYPRSMTMRFLFRRPALAVKLIAGLAALLLGSRLLPRTMRASSGLTRNGTERQTES